MFYEDIKLNMEDSLKKLAEFFGKPLEDEDLPRLMTHISFENVKKNPAVNFRPKEGNEGHIRRGMVGGNPEMTEEISKLFDLWTAENLKGSDLKFPHF